jgi:hypothetical protein
MAIACMSYPIGKILTSRPNHLIHIIIGGGPEEEIPILPLILFLCKVEKR